MFFRLLLCALVTSFAFSGCFENEKKKPDTEKKKEEKPKVPTIQDVSNDPSFQSFVGHLRQAVAKKDRRELSELMAPGFGYRWDEPPAGETPFDYWDKNNSWSELDSVLSQRFVPHEAYMVSPPRFAADSSFRGYRVGIRQLNGSWKMAYFVTGEDVLQ